MDEIVALGLVLELQQRGSESIDLITGRLTRFDEVLVEVDAAIGALDARVTALESGLGGLSGVATTAADGVGSLGSALGETVIAVTALDDAMITGGSVMGDYVAAGERVAEITVADADAILGENQALLAEIGALQSAAAENLTLAGSKEALVTAAVSATEAIVDLTGAETGEAAQSEAGAVSNKKLAVSKEELAAAALGATEELGVLTEAELGEAAEAEVGAGSNQKLALSKEDLAAAAEAAKDALLDLTMAEEGEGGEAVTAAGANERLAVAKGQVATAAELAAQAERDLAEQELLEGYESAKATAATLAEIDAEIVEIRTLQLLSALMIEVADGDQRLTVSSLEAAAAEAAQAAAAEADAAYLELLVAAEFELDAVTTATTASTLGLAGAMGALGGSMDITAGGAAIVGFLGNVKNLAVDVAEALGIVAVAGGIADVAAVKWASDFQDSMIKVEALSGVTHSQMLEYSDDILAMSQNTDVSAKSMGDALYFISTGAYKGAAALDVLDVSQKAAAAGLGQTKVVADAVTSALTAYHKPTSDAAHVTDVLIQAVIEGKAEADSFAGAMGRFLPIMAAAGISLEEGSASMATMTRVGLSAEESATALRQSINNLVAPTTQARKEMAALGLSTDDVRKMIADNGLLATYQKLIDMTHGDMDAIRELIPNIRAMTGVLAEIGPTGNAYADVLANIRASTGATDKAFEVAQGAISYQIGRMINDIKSIGIEIGDTLIPELNPKIHELGDWFIEQSHSVATFTAKVREISSENQLDVFTASLHAAGESIGENFGTGAEADFDHVTQAIGDMASGVGTGAQNIARFWGENIAPIPGDTAKVFSTEGGMGPVLTAIEDSVTSIKDRLGSWVIPLTTKLTQEDLPQLGTKLGDWFRDEAPTLENRLTQYWVPAGTKWVVTAGTDLVTEKFPTMMGGVADWAGKDGVPALIKVGGDLSDGLVKGMSDGLSEAMPKMLDRVVIQPFRDMAQNIDNLELLIKEGVKTGNWGDLNTGKTAPTDPRYRNALTNKPTPPNLTAGDVQSNSGFFDNQNQMDLNERGNGSDFSFFDNQEQMDVTERWANETVALVKDTTSAVINATDQVDAARTDMNTRAPTGQSVTARELAEQEAARKKAEAAQKKLDEERKRQEAYAAAHDPLAGLMQGLRDNKQNYIDEYGKLGGALASALDETLQAGTTASGKKVSAAIEAEVGALRAAEIPEWRALGDELADAIYGSMADPKNLQALESAQAEIGKINGILQEAADAKLGAKFWDEWSKGSEEASTKINLAIDAATEKIEKAHEKAATAAQAAWDKLNLSRELDAAHDKIEGLMKDYQTLQNSAKVDQSRGREDTSIEQTRENQITDLQNKRVNEVTDNELKQDRAMVDLRTSHIQRLADIRRDAHNKNQAIDIAKENEKYQVEIRNLQTKATREDGDRATKWDREDSSRSTSWSREDARRVTQRTQQDTDRLKEYADADALRAYKLGLEQQLGADKETLRERDYEKELAKIGETEQTAITAALADVDKITAAAEVKLDALWDKLIVKYKALFKTVTGGETGEGEATDETPSEPAGMQEINGPGGATTQDTVYLNNENDRLEVHGKIIKELDDEADSETDLANTAEAAANQRVAAVDAATAGLESSSGRQQLITSELGMATDHLALSTDHLGGSIGEAADQGERAARAFLEMRQPIQALTDGYDGLSAAASHASASMNVTGTLGNQGGGRDGTGGGAHDMSSTPGYPWPGYYYPSWIGTSMEGHQTNPSVAAPGTGAWNKNGGWFPKLAEGGIVDGPTLAEIGEGGEPEVVAPLSDLPALAPMMYPSGTQQLDLGALARVIVESLRSAPLVAHVDANQAVDAMAPAMFDASRDGRLSLAK